MNTQKTPLGGRPISRQEAFKGLGASKTWGKISDAVYAEFRAKPKTKRGAGSLVSATFAKKIAKVFGCEASPVKITMRPSQDVPEFLKKFDAIQKRTAQSALQLD